MSNVNILGANINPTKSNQTIFAGGEAILPQATVATIDADATNKALITKEWYNSKVNASLSNYYTKSESVNMFVGLNGVQTINGTKTFSSSPIVPTPTLNSYAVNKGYVDGNFIPSSQKNQANGVATLGSDGKHTPSQYGVQATHEAYQKWGGQHVVGASPIDAALNNCISADLS